MAALVGLALGYFESTYPPVGPEVLRFAWVARRWRPPQVCPLVCLGPAQMQWYGRASQSEKSLKMLLGANQRHSV